MATPATDLNETSDAMDEEMKEIPLIHLEAVGKRYREVVAVNSVDLDIRRGEFFTLLGPSGSGKTTTLRVIAGFEQPTTGSIKLDGSDITRIPPFDRDINTVFQDYALFPHMTIAKNLSYGLEAKRVPRSEIKERIPETLRMVNMENYADKFPTQLSGGQRQRIGLARAIINRPQVLLLDEPLGALDLQLRKRLQVELKQLQQELHITFVYVTHDQEEALSMSDRIAVFNQGEIEQMGSPHELYERPANDFIANFLGSSNLIEIDRERVMIRPEKIHLVADREPYDSKHWQIIDAVVEEKTFLGPITQYLVKLEDGTSLLVMVQNTGSGDFTKQSEVGALTRVAWRHENVYKIPINK